MRVTIKRNDGSLVIWFLKSSDEIDKKHVSCLLYDSNGYYQADRAWEDLQSVESINCKLEAAHRDGLEVHAYYNDGCEIPYKMLVI